MTPIKIMKVDRKSAAGTLIQMRKTPNHHEILLYYRVGCPPCDAMKPVWDAACDEFCQQYTCKSSDSNVVIANVDPTGLEHLPEINTVKGTPSLRYSSSAGVVSEFNDKRDKATLMKWLQHSLRDVITDNNDSSSTTTTIARRKSGGGGGYCLKYASKKRRYRCCGRKTKHTKRTRRTKTKRMYKY